MSEFTKGKWKYMNDGTIRACRPNSDILINIIEMAGFEDFKKVLGEEKAREMIDANARLAAAAPEMYKMIKNLVDGVTMAELLNGRQIIKVNPVLVESAKQLLARIDGDEHEELHEVEAQA